MVERCLDKAKMEVQFFQLLPLFIIAGRAVWLARQLHNLDVVSSNIVRRNQFYITSR